MGIEKIEEKSDEEEGEERNRAKFIKATLFPCSQSAARHFCLITISASIGFVG